VFAALLETERLTSRERVLAALNHLQPDRVPVDFWAVPETKQRLLAHLGLETEEALLSYLEIDLRYILGPSYVGQELRRWPDGSSHDLWGVRRAPITVQGPGYSWTYREVVESPLAAATTVADIDGYAGWPSAAWWDYSQVGTECRNCNGFAVVNVGDRMDRTAQLKPAMYLRGLEQFLMDLTLDPALAEAIISHIVDYYLDYNRRVFRAAQGKIDVFMMGDDFGTQNGPMVSVDMWRRFFRKGFRQYCDLAHRYGMKVMHHTCGSVRPLIPDLIDCGLDILQSLQPRARDMNLAELKREFGRDLCFHGSIDIQETMPRGRPEDVRSEVAARMAAGKPGGGFIICTAHNILPDVPVENILALYEACHDYGCY
jgi:uroporphyrinogen decarboxylase